jgi:hypothetical protein
MKGGNLLPKYVFDIKNENSREYIIHLPNMKIKLDIRSNKKDDVVFDIELFKRFAIELMKSIHLITKNRRSIVNIRYYYTTHKKTLPSDNKKKILTSEHVNSGLCYIDSTENDINIIIHRREEFHKVLTHEMLHLFDVIPFDKKLQELFEKRYPMIPYINANEAYVELNALILYTGILSDMLNKPFEILLAREQKFTNNQMNKLFKYFEFSSLKDYTKWNESTSAFSYYIVKGMLLNQLLKNKINNTYNTYFNFDNIDINSLRMTINDIENSNLLKDLI